MTNLTRWNPYSEMANFRRAMSRLFEEPFFNSDLDVEQNLNWEMPLDVVETPDEYLVQASLPGINPDDLDITYNNNTLTIRGEIKQQEHPEGKEHRYHIRERRWGSFTRSVYLPNDVNAGKIDAEYDAGILTLKLPKTEEVKPKRIPVKGTSGQKRQTIEAHAQGSKQR